MPMVRVSNGGTASLIPQKGKYLTVEIPKGNFSDMNNMTEGTMANSLAFSEASNKGRLVIFNVSNYQSVQVSNMIYSSCYIIGSTESKAGGLAANTTYSLANAEFLCVYLGGSSSGTLTYNFTFT